MVLSSKHSWWQLLRLLTFLLSLYYFYNIATWLTTTAPPSIPRASKEEEVISIIPLRPPGTTSYTTTAHLTDGKQAVLKEESKKGEDVAVKRVLGNVRRADRQDKQGKNKKKKNVLFLMTDDLRPSLSIYDKPVHTPNIERLAKISAVFERAYNQNPICNPSRNSLLTGRRPDTTRVYLFESVVKDDFVSIAHYFRHHGGYATYGSGKLQHWINSGMADYLEYFPSSTQEWNRMTDENYAWMNASVQPDDRWPMERYFDSRIAAQGIRMLRKAASHVHERPFFLGVGFHQPHRPWRFPRRFWDLYNNTDIPLPPNRQMPAHAPHLFVGDINPSDISLLPDGMVSFHVEPWKEGGGVPDHAVREQMRGYHSSISYVDYQIGQVLQELEKLRLVDDTIIVFCVDHGLNVGDHGLWDKR